MNDTDYEKLFEQEPEFLEYAKTAALNALMVDRKSSQAFLSSIYSFYCIGLSEEQIKQWLRNMKAFGPPPDEPEEVA